MAICLPWRSTLPRLIKLRAVDRISALMVACLESSNGQQCLHWTIARWCRHLRCSRTTLCRAPAYHRLRREWQGLSPQPMPAEERQQVTAILQLAALASNNPSLFERLRQAEVTIGQAADELISRGEEIHHKLSR